MSTENGLRVVKLTAENFKRLSAVEITPDPDAPTVTIAGRNAQGKSSVIDAIWTALAGAAAAKGTATTRPIRDGETSARVEVDLGDLVVTRSWSGEKSTLKVESKDGARYSSPQKMLDELIGRLSFDPLAFASLPAKAQQAELLQLVDLPFDPAELAARRAAVFDRRTEIGRAGKQLKGQLDGFGEFPADLPVDEVSVSQLLAELRDGEELARQIRVATQDIEAAKQRIRQLKEQLTLAQQSLTDAAARRETLPATAPDLAALEARIDGAEQINAMVRQRQARDKVAADVAAADAQWRAATAEINALDAERTAGLAAAAFPVPGLGFDDDGVTYNGVPFAQASTAERLRVSVAMAMALNPKVRVIRITDGSLLDSENLALIEGMASAGGFQVWIERVDESGTVGVVIEDGTVKA